jgi:UDP-N-acetylglucosamine 2-epimerase (non-hydrolysing)
MDEAATIMSTLAPDRVVQAVSVAIAQRSRSARAFRMVDDYQSQNVSKKVVRIILSYVDYVNRTVWHKSHQSDITAWTGSPGQHLTREARAS